MSQKPLWVGLKAPLDLCVVFSHYLIIFFNPFLIVTLFFIISYSYFFIIFLNPNSSFFSINKPLPLHFSSSSLFSLLRLLGLYLFGEQECFLQVCVGVWLVCLVGAWIALSGVGSLSLSGVIFPFLLV